MHHRPQIGNAFGIVVIAMASLAVAAAAPSSTAASRGPTPAMLAVPIAGFRPIGGGGNNQEHPEFDPIPGSAERTLAPLNFAPGTSAGLVSGPNPRTISNVISGGTGASGQDGATADAALSAWMYVFGQFVDHDLSLESAPPSSAAIDIAVPPGDPSFPAGTTIAMNRDRRNPATNTIVNTVAGYLDLSQLYGSTAAAAAGLRNADGMLIASEDGRALAVMNGVFVAGDARVMENPELVAVTTLFMREHNWWVSALEKAHPAWTGDQRYEMAKAITTAEYQNIIYQQFLPALIGNVLGPYGGYEPSFGAQVTQEFSTAAFRVGHSQVSDTQAGIDNRGQVVFSQALADAFFNTPAMDIANGIDPLLRSLGAELSQATDVYAVAALRNLLFAGLPSGGVDVIDLIAIDIQRERDVGLGTLNQTREALGLRPWRSFAQLTPDPVLQGAFAAVYGNVDAVDLFMGGLAEAHARGANVGPTFQAIIREQFEALRTGDRFFWLNQGFDKATAGAIAHTTLADLMKRNTDTTATLQPNLFIQAEIGGQVHQHPGAPQPRIVETHGRPFAGLNGL